MAGVMPNLRLPSQPQSTATGAVLISGPTEDEMLSWPEFLVTYQDSILRMVTLFSTNRAGCIITLLV